MCKSFFFFFSSRRRHTRSLCDWSSDVCSSDLDPLLRSLVADAPGRRVPGCVDPAEIAVRAVLGQQVSVAAARTQAARLTERCGERLPAPAGAVTHLFPAPGALAIRDPEVLLETDLGVRRGFARLADLAALVRCAEACRPWRSYAVQHLWSLA